MKTVLKLEELLSTKSKRNRTISKLYHGVIENIHQEQIMQFMSGGKKQFTQIGGLLQMSDKYTTVHLKRLMLNGLVARVLINEENDKMFFISSPPMVFY